MESYIKLLDCEDVRRSMRAVEIGEAHLVVEWQVLDICLELCPFYTTVKYSDLYKGTNFF